MKKRGLILGVIVSLLFMVLSVHAGPTLVLDQEQASFDTAPMTNLSNTGLGQSFQQDGPNIGAVGIYVQSNSSSTAGIAVTMSIYEYNTTSNPLGAFVGSKTALLIPNDYTGNGGWFDVEFDTPLLTNPVEDYFMEFTAAGLGGDIDVMGSRSNPYMYDPVFEYGYAFVQPNYSVIARWDYAFRTFTSVVPTPGALMLGAIGIGIVGPWRRLS